MDVKDQKRFVSVMNVLVETAGQGHEVKKRFPQPGISTISRDGGMKIQ